MVFGKVKKILKKSFTVLMASAIIVTSVPQASISAAAAEPQTVETVSEITEEGTAPEVNEDGTELNTETEENGSGAGNVKEEGIKESDVSEEELTDDDVKQEDESENASEEQASEEDKASVKETEEEIEAKEESTEFVLDSEGESSTANMALRFEMTAATSWVDLIQEDITGFSEITPLSKDYVISYDLYLPETASFTGGYYVKPVTKLNNGETGDNKIDWKWVDGEASDGKTLTRESFTADADDPGLVKCTYQGKIGEGAEAYKSIDAIVVAVGTSECSYNGVVFIDNVKLSDADGNELAVQDFTGYSGAVELGNMDGVSGGEGGDEPGQEQTKIIYEQDFDAIENLETLGNGNLGTGGVAPTLTEIAAGNKALKYTVDLSKSTKWTNIFQAEIQLAEGYTEEITDKANMSFDVYIPSEKVDSSIGTMKAQAVVKCGSNWDWTTQQSGPAYGETNFTEAQEAPGYKKLHISIDMNDFKDSKGNAKTIKDIIPLYAVIPCLAGDTSTYAGDIYLDNLVVTAYNKGTEEPPVIVEEDVILSLDTSAWSAEGSEDWLYTGSKAVNNISVGDKQILSLSVDYTNDAAEGWSEAKFDYTHPQEVASMNGYNTLKADVYYKPENKTKGGFAVKVFCGSLGIDTSVTVPEGTPVEGIAGLEGYYKAEISLGFKTKDAAFSNLTLGLVGQNTDYKGDILLDNVRFTQVIADDIYVDSTVEVKKGSGITVAEDGRSLKTASNSTVAIPTEVSLADANAVEATKNLYAYLEAVGKSDSVIFGHQNDTHHKAGSKGDGFSNSDTKDVTGSIAGVIGIDTLSLTGNEASSWDTPYEERIAKVADITKEAAAEGAIVTLSAHMPNFALIDEKVKKFEADGKVGATQETLGYWESADGKKIYNFSGYTPGETAGNVVERIMPGQDLNYLYTAYLDMIADYAKAVENDGITILFRPLHENTGSWFWWGAAFCDETAYINLFRYTVDYLKETKGVHNLLYVYGPGSEAENVEEYAARYPGDAYVDMIGYDLYHSLPTQDNEESYLANIKKQNTILREFAAEHHKLYAITETGVANGEIALLPSGNEVKDWYMKLLGAISEDKQAGGTNGGVCYFLVWANFGADGSFYTPYVLEKKDNGVLYGHETLDDFINFYNDARSVFATDMNNGFQKVKGVTNTTKADRAAGYIVTPTAGARVLDKTTIQARVTGVSETSAVRFVLTQENDAEIKVTLGASYNQTTSYWEAVLEKEELDKLGEALGSIALLVNDQEVAKTNVLFNMPEKEADPLVPDDFEGYGGSDRLLGSSWAVNKETASSIGIKLTKEKDKVFGGSYGFEMDITLAASTAWAGATKNMEQADWSSANALEFYTIPEKNGQKIVVQVTSGGKVFEVYLQELPAYVEAAKNNVPVKVTIPFSCFKGRDNANDVFQPNKIDSIGLWCNAIAVEGTTFPLQTTLYYDEIKAVTTDKTEIGVEEYKAPDNPDDPDNPDNPDNPDDPDKPDKPDDPQKREGIWIEEIEDQVYTGKAIKPEVAVYDSGELLVKNKDYTIKYANNTNAGEAKVIIKGKGNYGEQLEKTFKILPKDLGEVTVTIPEAVAYKNSEQTIKVTVKDGKRTLKLNRDYELWLKAPADTADTNTDEKGAKKADKLRVKEEGDYTVWVKAGSSGNYTGEAEVSFMITKKTLLSKAKITLPSGSLDYADGKAVTFDPEQVKVKLNGKEIAPVEEGTVNYEITYENNYEVGKEAYIVIKAGKNSEYAGSVKKKFTIKGEAFSTKTVFIDSFVEQTDYNGSELHQDTMVLYDKAKYDAAGTEAEKQAAKLVEGTDYEISYKNCKNAGKASVTLTGKGKYTGRITKNYTIKKVTLTADMVENKTVIVEHSKAGAKPDVAISYNGMTLVNGTDYTLSYTNNKNITTADKKAYITVNGKGNYAGKLNKIVEMTINPKSLQSKDITIVVPDVKYKASTKEYKPTPVVYDDGKKLKKGTDYLVAYENNTKEEVGTVGGEGNKFEHEVTVIITAVEGKNYYVEGADEAEKAQKNTRRVTFRITAKMIKDAKVEVINKQSFKLQGVVPEKTDLKVTFGKDKTPVTNEEFEIISCTKNDKKGAAVMVIQGKGQYGGTKTVKFAIGARGMDAFKEK